MREEDESKLQIKKEEYEALYAEHDEEVCKGYKLKRNIIIMIQ